MTYFNFTTTPCFERTRDIPNCRTEGPRTLRVVLGVVTVYPHDKEVGPPRVEGE